MLSLAVFLSAFILFFILSPGVLLRLPPKGDKVTTAVVHAIVFSILFSLVLMFVQKVIVKEGYEGGPCYDMPKSDPTGKYMVIDTITNEKVMPGKLSIGSNCRGPKGSCFNGLCASKICDPITGTCLSK
jgi:hypothetical protein